MSIDTPLGACGGGGGGGADSVALGSMELTSVDAVSRRCVTRRNEWRGGDVLGLRDDPPA
jgi:hypothetical protein